MSKVLEFNKVYAGVSADVPAEMNLPEVSNALEGILFHQNLNYRLDDLLGAHFCTVTLSQDPVASGRDMIFRMPAFGFFEVILHSADGQVRAGGWLFGSEPVLVTDQIAHGFLVIHTKHGNSTLQHAYHPQSAGYVPEFGDQPAPLTAAKRLAGRLG